MKWMVVLSAAMLALAGNHAVAQEKQTVSGLLAQGYQVIHSEIGNPFLQFILKKENQLVWCSVLLQSGETSSCRTIK